MTIDKSTNILIIGLGVIGGGYATALTREGYTVKCITKNKEDIEYALARGMISEGTTEVNPVLVGAADLIICALYPTVFIEWVKENQHLFKSGAILTDVTGVKGAVVERVQSFLRSDVEFIAAHPMAGRERSGVTSSRRQRGIPRAQLSFARSSANCSDSRGFRCSHPRSTTR